MNFGRMVWLDDGTLRCVLDFYAREAEVHVVLHLKIWKWGVSQARKIAMGLAEIRATLGIWGFACLEVLVPEASERTAKMARRYGFRETRRKNGWVLMAVKNA